MVDPHQNITAYRYTSETNYYAAGPGKTVTPYVRGGVPASISYGQRVPDYVAKTTTGAQVLFTTAQRCKVVSGFDCTAAISKTNASHWPDVPYDQNCASSGACTNYSPTFWSLLALSKITTRVWDVSLATPAWTDVDTYTLSAPSFPDPGDFGQNGGEPTPALWLSSVTHAGVDTRAGGTAVTLSPVTFSGSAFPNRVRGLNITGVPPINRFRLTTITSEAGAPTVISYRSDDSCDRANPPTEDNNDQRCYPKRWTPIGYADPLLDWFYTYPVEQIAQNDNTAAWGASASPALITNYTYADPGWHRDDSEFTPSKTRTWDQFRGYRHVTTQTGAQSDVVTKTVTDYLLGMDKDYRKDNNQRSVTVQPTVGDAITDSRAFTGMPYQVTTYASDSGAAQQQTITRPWQSAATTATQVLTGVPDRSASYVRTAQTDTRQRLADGTWRTTRVNTGFNADTGQGIISDNLGEINAAGDPIGATTPRLCTSTQYARDTTRNIVLPSLVIATAGACQQDVGANTMRATRTYYDSGSLGTATGVTDVTSTQTLKAAPGTWATASTSTYDVYGRLTKTVDPEARSNTVSYGTTAATQKYLPVVVSATNPASWTSTTTLAPGRQLPVTSTNFNGRITSQTYDGLGRVTGVWLPNHTKASYASTPSMKYAYTLTSNTVISTTTSTLQDSGLYSIDIDFYDALLRQRQRQSTPRNNAAGARLINNTRYDSHGWTASTTGEFYNNASAPSTTPNTTVTGSDIPMVTQTSYDGRGRTTGTTSIANGVLIATSNTSYPGEDQVRTTPPNGGTPTLTTIDGRGQHTMVEENPGTSGGEDATMRYYFDAAGQQTKFVGPLAPTADAAHSPLTWTTSYDAHGNAVTSSDPDSGTTTNTYNNDDELLTTTTTGNETGATARTLTYNRADPAKLGRVTTLYNGLYNGSATSATKVAAWTFDTATSGKGQPATATRYDAAGATATWTMSVAGYTPLDQPTATTTTIPAGAVGNTSAITYSNTNTYTPTKGMLSNTVIRETGTNSLMPDERYSFAYNGQGLPVASGGIAQYETNTEYDPHGRVIRAVAGSMPQQVAITHSWEEPTGRLRNTTVSKEDGQAAPSDVGYTYNESGQITSASEARDGGALTDTQCYRYDKLQRLTDVWTDGAGTTGIQQHGVLGNCNNTNPDSASTTFTGPAPYWQTYTYDLTGNRVSRTDHAVPGSSTAAATTTQTYSGTGDAHAVRNVTFGSGTAATVQTYSYNGGRPTNTSTTVGGEHQGTRDLNYTWTPDNQLATLTEGTTTSPAHQSTYSYDAEGNHVARTTDGETTLQLGDDTVTLSGGTATRVERQHTFPGGVTTVRTAVSATGGGSTAMNTDAMHYQAPNPQGTALVDITADTLTVSRHTYTPFGEERATANLGASFAGQRGFLDAPTDTTTGLTTLGVRQYNPALGQFLSVDPLVDSHDSQQINGFSYADGDPVNNTDADGRSCNGGPDGMCRTSGGDLIPTPGISDRQAIDVSGPSNTSPATAPAANPKDTQVTLKITTNQPTCSVCGSHYVTQIVRTTLYDLQHPKKPTDKNHCGWFGFVCDVLGVNSVIDCIQSPSWGSCISAVVSIIGDVLIAGTAIKAGQLARVANGEKLAAADATAGERIAATCGGGSFSPDTRVVMADGSTKPLDRVKVGDKVEATDTTTGKTTAKTVTTLWVNHDTDLMDVTVKAGEKTSLIHATQKHLFWDPVRRAWVQADQLKVGEALRTDNGLTTTVASTAILPGAANMWDLTITNDHDFYIATTTANVLVHNQTCNLPGPGDVPTKVVNSNMGHIDAERAGRAGFTTVRGAQGAVRDLSNSIASHGFPAGTIADTARADRVLVPIGNGGLAVYQIAGNGNAVFKTILTAK